MKTSAKFIITSLFLCLAVIFTAFTATSTIQAYQAFQQDHQRIQVGDATTVRAWMTIPYIAHVYKVPEPCFTQTLHLTDRELVKYATLRVLADHYQRPLPSLINAVQQVITAYHHKRMTCGLAPPTTSPTSAHASPTPIRKGKAP